MRKYREALIIMRKELRGMFTTPIAYIVMTIFLIATGFFFFKDFFYFNQAEMRNFFQLLPLIFTFVVPAVTMRLFAEEKQSGSMEILLTLPVSTTNAVLGKFLAAAAFISLMLVPTLFYVVTVELSGSPYYGPIIGGYLGAVLLGSAYCAVGILTSSLSRDQIVAFITAWAGCFFLWLVDKITLFLPSWLGFLEYLSSDFHFKNIERGVLDSRDLIYFLSIIVISLLVTVRVIDERR
ncbi:MAG: ABC transporter permease subunit [Spirochaetes bacterium]|nr:ABC transporter permease subunit [Spirochaetota bacterium]